MKSVCVYCGANAGATPIYASTATELGRHLADAGLRLVYGGGNTGLMGAVANGVLDEPIRRAVINIDDAASAMLDAGMGVDP